jgi:DNA-binding NarL/FixJ family response regulator
VGRRLQVARQTLGEGAFDALWEAGRALSLEEAVAEALEIELEQPAQAAASVTRGATPPGNDHPLSPRERDVAVLVAQGLTNRGIAERLIITEGTAGVHVVHVLNQLGLRSRAQIAAWAVEHGLAASRGSS